MLHGSNRRKTINKTRKFTEHRILAKSIFWFGYINNMLKQHFHRTLTLPITKGDAILKHLLFLKLFIDI